MFLKNIVNRIVHYNDGAMLGMFRQRRKSGSNELINKVRMGPNAIHVGITRVDGSYEDLGVSYNLLTNIGRDWLCGNIGGFPAAGNTVAANISTGVSSTSITGTGSVWTASNLATPQLGLAGMRVYAAPNTSTNPVVYGNIISNTTNVLTIDKWWKADDVTGTTPTSGDAFIIAPGGMAAARFMALTTNSSAASASNTVLASEITTNGGSRALATYAHTFGASTFTLQKAFSISGTLTAIHRMGLFTALSAAGADPMIFETVLNQDATVGNGDTLTVTDTLTVSG
jgi:hypothetical protein